MSGTFKKITKTACLRIIEGTGYPVIKYLRPHSINGIFILGFRLALLMVPGCLLLSCGPRDPRPAIYEVIDIGTLGGDFSRAEDVNDHNTVVGQAAISGSPHHVHAFLWHDGHMTDLNDLPSASGEMYPGTDGVARSINSEGDVVGSIDIFSDDPYGQDSRARLWRNGKRFDLRADKDLILGLPGSEAYKINNKGSILGNAILHERGPTSDLYQAHRFLYERGVIKAIGYESDSFGVNNQGDQCGCTTGSPYAHVILRRGSREQDLGSVPGPGVNILRGIVVSDKDEVAGTATTYTGADPTAEIQFSPTAFRWHEGTWSKLAGLPGDPISIVGGINDAGQIVGEVRPSANTRQELPPPGRAVLWTGNAPQDLNRLIRTNSGWILQGATAINDRGSIVGYGSIGGEIHGFILIHRAARQG